MNFLLQHALSNVWCAPRQDLSTIMTLARITGYGGVFNEFRIGPHLYALPTKRQRYHVFQIGQLSTKLMGIEASKIEWHNFAEVCAAENMVVDIYNQFGVQYPRFETWFKITKNNNVLIAIKDQTKIDIKNPADIITLRTYSPSYFMINSPATELDEIVAEGRNCLSVDDILYLQNKVEKHRLKPGAVICHVNGKHVANINLITVQLGDVVEYLYDASIYKTIDFKIKDLQTFTSKLDTKRKYLLHYSSATKVDTIDYYDDIDIYLVAPLKRSEFSGIYYHRNTPDAVRMVTHRDYSVPVTTLLGFVQDREQWGDPEELTLKLYIRRSGWKRPLLRDSNRIMELYKMTDSRIMGAMLGLHATIPEWRAENLENSFYTKIMSAKGMDISLSDIEKAYGYNTISKIIGDSPVSVYLHSGQKLVDVPPVMQSFSTAYEFDKNGKFLVFYSHIAGQVYSPRNPYTEYVQFITGTGSQQLDEYYDKSIALLSNKNDYRFYICPKVVGMPNNEWEDVTGSFKYGITNGKVEWLIDHEEFHTLVRGNSSFLAYTFTDLCADGIIEFNITSLARKLGNPLGPYPMSVKMGRLDLFLNGRYLIENVDYIMHFPRVVIINKEYLITPNVMPQSIHVRWTGFCDEQLEHEGYKDAGFVQYGQLSRNGYFNLRDDRVCDIFVDGLLTPRDKFSFAEDNIGANMLDPNNGAPYVIRDVLVATRGMTIADSQTLRKQAREADDRFEGYLTTWLPEVKPDDPNVIRKHYQVFSPMICKIISDLDNGILNDQRIYAHYNDSLVTELCARYMWLLDFDPTQAANLPDLRYVSIHPTNAFTEKELTIWHYKFVERVINLYMKGKVNLSHFVTIKNYGIED